MKLTRKQLKRLIKKELDSALRPPKRQLTEGRLRRLVREQFDTVMGEADEDYVHMPSVYWDALAKAGYKNHDVYKSQTKNISDLAQKAKNPGKLIAALVKNLLESVPAAEQNDGGVEQTRLISKILNQQLAWVKNYLQKKAAKKPAKPESEPMSPEDKARHLAQGEKAKQRKWANVFGKLSTYLNYRKSDPKKADKAGLIALMKKEGVPPDIQKRLLNITAPNVREKALELLGLGG